MTKKKKRKKNNVETKSIFEIRPKVIRHGK